MIRSKNIFLFTIFIALNFCMNFRVGSVWI